MRVEFVGRSVVCLVVMPPTSLDLQSFETAIGLDRPTTQVTNPQLAVAEYPRLRLLVTPDGRAQCEFASNASTDICRRAAAELIRQAEPFAPRAVGFNGQARLEAEPEEEPPVAGLFNAEAVASFLRETPERSGAKFVYRADDRATLTLDISPAENEPSVWIVSINRHYAGRPDAETRERGVSWLAALSNELPPLVRRLPEGINARG